MFKTSKHLLENLHQTRGGIRRGGGGGGGYTPSFSWIRHPFLATNPKNFLEEPLAPIRTKFEGERAPNKRDFLV